METGPFSVPVGGTSPSQSEVSIGFNWGEEEEGKEKEREGGIKAIGKLPSGAGVCLTTDFTSTLHTLGKCDPA